MNEFTHAVATAAITELRKGRGGKAITMPTLIGHMNSLMIEYRDAKLDEWRDQILDHVPHERLEYLYFAVRDEMFKWGLYDWELPDDEWLTEWVAWGLACVRWLNQEYAERTPQLIYADDELQAWLNERNPLVQLPLF